MLCKNCQRLELNPGWKQLLCRNVPHLVLNYFHIFECNYLGQRTLPDKLKTVSRYQDEHFRLRHDKA